MGLRYLVVAGNGETTRVNVEALLEDHFRGIGKDVMLVLPFTDRPSQGQVWAHQVANELGVQTTVVAPENSMSFGISSSSMHPSENPLASVVTLVQGELSEAFLLWSEDDPFSKAAREAFKTAGIGCYDLCMGLFELSGAEAPIAPVKPSEPLVAELPLEPEPEVEVSHAGMPVIVSEDLAKAIGKAVAKAVTEVLEKYGISG